MATMNKDFYSNPPRRVLRVEGEWIWYENEDTTKGPCTFIVHNCRASSFSLLYEASGKCDACQQVVEPNLLALKKLYDSNF